jgi:transcription factor 1
VTAAEGTTTRCKLSVIARATVDLEECVPATALQPYTEHFHPELVYNSQSNLRGNQLEPRKLGTPHMAIRALPLKKQVSVVQSRTSEITNVI